jgi:nitrate reductase gamma subunit
VICRREPEEAAMHSLYQFISGPLFIIAFTIFIGGILYRILQLIFSVSRKESFIFSYMSLRFSLRSLLHWLIPFLSVLTRKHPFLTVVTFTFHIGIFIVPIFLLSHIVLWDESLDIRWWALPDRTADIMTLFIIASCIFFLIRRLVLPQVRYLTSISDFLILFVAASPFITGYYASQQWPGYPYAMILHILSGEILMIAIPFTRLRHMILGIFTRAYMGSEFGGVRHVKDW